MNRFQILAIVYAGLISTALLIQLTVFICSRSRRWRAKYANYTSLARIVPRHRWIGPWSLKGFIRILAVLGVHSFLLLFRAAHSWEMVGKNAGILAVVTFMPLYTAFHHHFAAHMINVSLWTYRRFHRDLTIVTSLLIGIHAVIMSVQVPSPSLKDAEHLNPVVVRNKIPSGR